VRHQAQDGLSDDEVNHDLKQKAKLDNSANKISEFMVTHQEKLGSRSKPVKSNITDNDSAKMTTSKGTIQGYNGIAINDDKHQIILQAQTWGSVGEQQTLQPAIEQLNHKLEKLGTPNAFKTAKFTADSCFHSEANFEYMATTGLDSHMADTQCRSRNPLFKTSKAYHTAQEKRRLKRSKGKPRLFTRESFNFDPITNICVCPADKTLWRQRSIITTKDKSYSRFTGYLKDCRTCPLQKQYMRKPPK